LEELSLDKNFVTYFEIRSRGILCISRFLIMLLGHRDFRLAKNGETLVVVLRALL